MKKLLVMLLCAVMMTTFMPAMTFAADDVPESPNANETTDTEEGERVEAGGETAETVGTVNTAEALQAAIESVEAGGTITLGADITGSILIDEAKKFTLDLGTYTLTGQIRVVHSDAEITVKNGKVIHDGANANEATVAVGLGHVILEEGLTVESTGVGNSAMAIAAQDRLDANGVIVRGNAYGIGVLGSAKVNLTNMNVETKGNPISSAAANGNSDMVVNINGGTYTCTNATGDWSYVGIYWASHGTLNIDGAVKVTSKSPNAACVYAKNGSVNIKNGSFVGTRDGLKIASESGDSTELHVTIEGGTFDGKRTGLYTKSTASSAASGKYTVTITDGSFGGTDWGFYSDFKGPIPEISFTGGTFTNVFKTDLAGFITGGTYSFNINETAYMAEGHYGSPNGDETWTVKIF